MKLKLLMLSMFLVGILLVVIYFICKWFFTPLPDIVAIPMVLLAILMVLVGGLWLRNATKKR